MLIVENNAGAHLAHAVTALAGFQAEFVCPRALGTLGGIGTVKHVSIKVPQVTAFLADHLVQAPVELDSAGPWRLDIEGDLGRQGGHGGLNAINVLRVQARETVLLSQRSHHVVECGGFCFGCLFRQRPHHILK